MNDFEVRSGTCYPVAASWSCTYFLLFETLKIHELFVSRSHTSELIWADPLPDKHASLILVKALKKAGNRVGLWTMAFERRTAMRA